MLKQILARDWDAHKVANAKEKNREEHALYSAYLVMFLFQIKVRRT